MKLHICRYIYTDAILIFRYVTTLCILATVRHTLQQAKFYENISADCLFITVHDAVVASLSDNPQLQQQVRGQQKILRLNL